MSKRPRNTPTMFALGMLAMMIPSQAFGAFYFYYYVDTLGLGVALATIARTVFLVWDAVNQPLAGYLSDCTQSRFGRRRPWLFGAIPLFMLSFVMVFSPPKELSEAGLFTWFLIALVFFEAVSTVIWVNYGALFPELFKGNRLRAKASAIQQGYQIVAILIGTAATPILFDAIGYGNMSIVYALIFCGLMLLFLANIQEDAEAQKAPQMRMKDAFKMTFRNKPFWIFNIANSFAQTVNGLLASTIPFYAKYVLDIPEAQNTILFASVFVSVIPLVAVWYWIMNKVDPVKGWRISLLAYALSVIPLWFGSNLIGGILAGILVGFGLAGFLVTPPVVSSLIIDRDYEKTGSRREGIYTAVGGFVTRSSGLIAAVAFLIVGLVFGYESGDDPGPDPESTFRYLISVIPFGLLCISFLVSLFMTIERKKAHES
ncbi:MFS transporter [Cohnella sp. GCM10027633]|uniref:MFS transporter n=1 Tax=unclassified Cohnella TaxID=2636738 RepID=UPI003630FB5E